MTEVVGCVSKTFHSLLYFVRLKFTNRANVIDINVALCPCASKVCSVCDVVQFRNTKLGKLSLQIRAENQVNEYTSESNYAASCNTGVSYDNYVRPQPAAYSTTATAYPNQFNSHLVSCNVSYRVR